MAPSAVETVTAPPAELTLVSTLTKGDYKVLAGTNTVDKEAEEGKKGHAAAKVSRSCGSGPLAATAADNTNSTRTTFLLGIPSRSILLWSSLST